MASATETQAPPAAVLPPLIGRGPLAWLKVFGPGAVLASITIGSGELIFSTRGGALFGYRILFLFVLISVLKWGLVVAAARHMVLTGVHPYQRMVELPGPRGWVPLVLFLIAAVCMPIWVSFFGGILGNLTSWVTGTQGRLGGAVDYLWGAGFLAAVLLLTACEGYAVLERLQTAIVGLMLLCVGVTMVLYNPDWLELVLGVVPRPLAYPGWLDARYPRIASQPVWVETTRYVGVIGGAAYDYLAYTSFLREKGWGRSGRPPATAAELDEIASDPRHPVRQWLRAPLIDCTLSFGVVVLFSAVFVASGAQVLGPAHEVPDESNMLTLQAQFVTQVHPWLLPLYFCGAFLAMLGTLYGTIAIACTILSEMAWTFDPQMAVRRARRLKSCCVAWCAVGAYAVLAWMFVYQLGGGGEKPRLLLAILTPANLFTGVLFCGLLCLMLPWIDRRFLPAPLRAPAGLTALNLVSAVVFLALGVKGYWDHESRWLSLGSLCGLLLAGLAVASLAGRRTAPQRADEGRLPGLDPSPGP